MKTCSNCKYSQFKLDGAGRADGYVCEYEAHEAVSSQHTCDAHELSPHFVLDADENPADEPPTTPEIAEDSIYEFLDYWFTSAQAIEILDTLRKRFEDEMIVELTEAFSDEHPDDEAQLQAALQAACRFRHADYRKATAILAGGGQAAVYGHRPGKAVPHL